MASFVGIRSTVSGAEGTCPLDALDYWRERGYVPVDQAEVDEAREAEAASPFNPTEKTAAAVNEYLSGLDQADPAQVEEYDRVVALEQAGADRTTAYPTRG